MIGVNERKVESGWQMFYAEPGYGWMWFAGRGKHGVPNDNLRLVLDRPDWAPHVVSRSEITDA